MFGKGPKLLVQQLTWLDMNTEEEEEEQELLCTKEEGFRPFTGDSHTPPVLLLEGPGTIFK